MSEKAISQASAAETNSMPSEHKNLDTENLQDGLFHQYIEKDGSQVLVSWTKEEEKSVVRKADFLFLPIFSVCKSSLNDEELTHRDLFSLCFSGWLLTGPMFLVFSLQLF